MIFSLDYVHMFSIFKIIFAYDTLTINIMDYGYNISTYLQYESSKPQV